MSDPALPGSPVRSAAVEDFAPELDRKPVLA